MFLKHLYNKLLLKSITNLIHLLSISKILIYAFEVATKKLLFFISLIFHYPIKNVIIL